jgi:hypothetical protein
VSDTWRRRPQGAENKVLNTLSWRLGVSTRRARGERRRRRKRRRRRRRILQGRCSGSHCLFRARFRGDLALPTDLILSPPGSALLAVPLARVDWLMIYLERSTGLLLLLPTVHLPFTGLRPQSPVCTLSPYPCWERDEQVRDGGQRDTSAPQEPLLVVTEIMLLP